MHGLVNVVVDQLVAEPQANPPSLARHSSWNADACHASDGDWFVLVLTVLWAQWAAKISPILREGNEVVVWRDQFRGVLAARLQDLLFDSTCRGTPPLAHVLGV